MFVSLQDTEKPDRGMKEGDYCYFMLLHKSEFCRIS